MAFIAMLLLLAENLALGRTYPWAFLPYELGRWGWIVLSFGLVALLAEQAGWVNLGERWHRFAAAAEAALGRRAALVGLIAANALFATMNWWHFGRFGYGFPWAHFVVLAAAAAFVRRDRFWLSCLVSLGLLVASIIHFPEGYLRSDMLDGIRSAWDHLAVGRSPYTIQEDRSQPDWIVMLYLPLTFFSHAPAWVLGLDLRWNQVLYRSAWMLVFGLALPRLRQDSPWITLAHVFVLNPYYNFRHELYYEAFLFGIVAYHAWPRWRWISLPALVWTRQWAWIMAPYLALDWLAVQRQLPGAGQGGQPLDWRRAARQAGWLVLGAAGITVLVFAALWPTTTVQGAVARFMNLMTINDHHDYGLTLGPLGTKLGLSDWMRPLQTAGMAALGLLTLGYGIKGRLGTGAAATEGLERMGLIALYLFVLTATYHEVYFWTDPAFWCLVAYTYRPEGVRGPLLPADA